MQTMKVCIVARPSDRVSSGNRPSVWNIQPVNVQSHNVLALDLAHLIVLRDGRRP
jgi:hypothetical protein